MEDIRKMKSIVFKELPVHDTCWSITTGSDGNIYIGVCSELTGGQSVFIVQYNPVNGKTEYLLDVASALGEPSDSGRAPYSKIHYCLLPSSDGKLYCATHCSGLPINHPVWRPWHTWDDPEKMHPGFHIFSFDPKTEELVDFGIMSPNEGSRAMALAEKRGLLYGITWPRDLYFADTNNRQERMYIYTPEGAGKDFKPMAAFFLERSRHPVRVISIVIILKMHPAKLKRYAVL